MKKGASTIIDAGFPENDLKKKPAAMAAITNSIPPITSHFQAITNIPVKIKAGILCIKNPSIFLPGGSFPLNASKENITMKRIAIIARIRGIQKNAFVFIAPLISG